MTCRSAARSAQRPWCAARTRGPSQARRDDDELRARAIPTASTAQRHLGVSSTRDVPAATLHRRCPPLTRSPARPAGTLRPHVPDDPATPSGPSTLAVTRWRRTAASLSQHDDRAARISGSAAIAMLRRPSGPTDRGRRPITRILDASLAPGQRVSTVLRVHHALRDRRRDPRQHGPEPLLTAALTPECTKHTASQSVTGSPGPDDHGSASCGPRGTRTHNPRIKSPLLCQLS